MTYRDGHDPTNPDFTPLDEWGYSLRTLGMGIGRVAALYWHTQERAIKRLQLCGELRLQTLIYVQRFVNAGTANCSLPPFKVHKDDPVLFEWVERNVEFRNRADALHTDLRRGVLPKMYTHS